ncbi:MAG: L-serine ammonia-lyase [Gammaproteobacteria bacterium]|nr:L-serine ammonia-lyase [Gammaproteobacteria bacterium]
MFISVLELFKIGIGPSSSHTMGPMLAAQAFVQRVKQHLFVAQPSSPDSSLRCTLKGSLSFTGKGHATDRAVALGLHGYLPEDVAQEGLDAIVSRVWCDSSIELDQDHRVLFNPEQDIIFDQGEALSEHPNGMIFELLDQNGKTLLAETYFSLGGGFISTRAEMNQSISAQETKKAAAVYGFSSARLMLEMSADSQRSIAEMKRCNELQRCSNEVLNQGLDAIWSSMLHCLKSGLLAEGLLPGGLNLPRRAKDLHQQLLADTHSNRVNANDWLCAYAMAVNEENATGHRVVTAPTNGAAGVIPAILYYFILHEAGTAEQVRTFLLTAAAIGGLIKHNGSISGAEVGCQGEVGVAASMAAAGLCAVRGGSTEQIENAAEMALEHHLGMTCDPVKGLVQVPCIERNGFGAIKAYTAASLAMRGSGQHLVTLDDCIAAMKQTGMEMSVKFKETSLGGLAVNIIEC